MLVTKRSLKKKSSLQILFISKKKQKNKQRRKGSIISGSNIWQPVRGYDKRLYNDANELKMQYDALGIMFLKKKMAPNLFLLSKKQRRKGSIISGSNIDNMSVDVIKFEQHELTKMQYNALDILFFKEKMAPNIFLIFRKLRRKESILSGYNIDNLSVDVIKRLQ